MIDQDIVSGKVFVDDKEERIFLCQNYRQGYESPIFWVISVHGSSLARATAPLNFRFRGIKFRDHQRAPRPKIKKADTRFAMSPDFTTEHIYRGKNGYHCGVGYNFPSFLLRTG
jgi:hypothetical protein